MSESDELYRTVEGGPTGTLGSFTDLDSISGTTGLGLTFLPSAQITHGQVGRRQTEHSGAGSAWRNFSPVFSLLQFVVLFAAVIVP